MKVKVKLFSEKWFLISKISVNRKENKFTVIRKIAKILAYCRNSHWAIKTLQ